MSLLWDEGQEELGELEERGSFEFFELPQMGHVPDFLNPSFKLPALPVSRYTVEAIVQIIVSSSKT